MISISYHPRAVTLPLQASEKRTIPRAPSQCEPGYLEKFDARTLFFDCFRDGSDIVCVAPKVRNLIKLLENGFLRQDGVQGPSEFELIKLDRVDLIRIKSSARIIGVQTDAGAVDVPVAETMAYLFEGRKSLFTLSKDNNIDWICDWANFYKFVHGVDAVLVYDNGSSSYSSNDIREALTDRVGLETVVVVDWPFKYGPLSAPINGRRKRFDSNYCQLGMMEHAKRMFLSKSKMVINADIDELIVVRSEGRLEEYLENSTDGYLKFSGLWVHIDRDVGRIPRHYDYAKVSQSSPSAMTKWVIDPRRIPDEHQWTTHEIARLPANDHKTVRLRHFRGINTKWKTDMRSIASQSPQNLEFDTALLRDYAKAFFPEILPRSS